MRKTGVSQYFAIIFWDFLCNNRTLTERLKIVTSRTRMAILNTFSQISFALWMWLFLNGLIFLVPGLSWIKYPILLNVEALALVFIICCVVDASHWRPWKEAAEVVKQIKGGARPRRVVINSFSAYLSHFGVLALVWSLELVLQKMVFSTVFTTTLHYIDHSKDPFYVQDSSSEDENNVSWTCMDGTLLFSVRQSAIVLALCGTLFLERNDPLEKRYLKRVAPFVCVICIGAFLAVWNNQASHPTARGVVWALVWVFLRTSRLLLTKWVQKKHQTTLGMTRFLRLLLPFMFVLLVPSFLVVEFPELKSMDGVLTDGSVGTDHDWFGLVLSHTGVVCIYALLFSTSLFILLGGGNAVDYNSWLMLREVIWNTTCSHAIGEGSLTIHVLGAHQIAGLTLFLISWVSYLVLYFLRFIQRIRGENPRYVQIVDFVNIKDVDLRSWKADEEDNLQLRVTKAQRHSDDLSREGETEPIK